MPNEKCEYYKVYDEAYVLRSQLAKITRQLENNIHANKLNEELYSKLNSQAQELASTKVILEAQLDSLSRKKTPYQKIPFYRVDKFIYNFYLNWLHDRTSTEKNNLEHEYRSLLSQTDPLLKKMGEISASIESEKEKTEQLKTLLSARSQAHHDLLDEVKSLFKKFYNMGFIIYKNNINVQNPKTSEELLLVSMRDFLGAVVAHLQNPSNITRETVTRRYCALDDHIKKDQSDDAKEIKNKSRTILSDLIKLDPLVELSIKNKQPKSKDPEIAEDNEVLEENKNILNP